MTFALFFANRGFFPGELIDESRDELCNTLREKGYDYICMDGGKTRFDAVETPEEGKIYAEFLEENKGKYDGIIVSLPNFGDENGAVVALRGADVPILVQAFPDEIGLMDFTHRRDAMCGKFAMCNVLRQAKIPFTLTKDFVVSPSSESFKSDLDRFASICRIANGMKNFNVGMIGARTSAFKTVRIDEVALQNSGINVETIDLSEVFSRAEKVTDEQVKEKIAEIEKVTVFEGYPTEKLEKMAKLQVVLEDIAKAYNLSAMAIRCWPEFQTVMGIAPCTNVGILNEMGIATACETDVSNAVMMRALSLAADAPTMLLDFNNNYGDAKNKAIMFHCGPMAISLMKGKGKTIEHLMFKKSYGEGSGVGVNKGEMLEGTITFGSIRTEGGKVKAFVSDGKFTNDDIEKEFFGSGKVVEKEGIYDIADYMAKNGYKHHICITYTDLRENIKEAFENYLGYEVDVF